MFADAAIMMYSVFHSSFQDIMGNDAQREFFRKFLATNSADDAFNFLTDLQLLSKTYDPKAKTAKLAYMKHKYLRDPETGMCGCLEQS